MLAVESLDFIRKIDLTDTEPEEKFATGLCVPFVDISLRASFYSASHSSTQNRVREFAWSLKRHTVLYRLNTKFLDQA